jgi:hypothetical protein
MHILHIHITALIVNVVVYGSPHQSWYETAPLVNVPEINRWGLPLLYVVWAVDVAILYMICKWYANYKAAHPGMKLLKYI